MKTFRYIFSLVVLLLVSAGFAHAIDSVSVVIAKARAYAGSEAALSALKSLHYVGTLETEEDTAAGPRAIKLKIELIFQKPYRSRTIFTADKKIEITALDDYEAWQRQQDTKDKDNWLVTLMPPAQVKSLRANTWENLAFFSGIESRGGQIEDRGVVEVDGVKCRKLAYIHDAGIFFIRCFAVDSGRLLLTETDQGTKMRESGEIMAGGIRLPKQIISTNQLAAGKTRVVTLTFDRITVNEEFPENLFQVPTVQLK